MCVHSSLCSQTYKRLVWHKGGIHHYSHHYPHPYTFTTTLTPTPSPTPSPLLSPLLSPLHHPLHLHHYTIPYTIPYTFTTTLTPTPSPLPTPWHHHHYPHSDTITIMTPSPLSHWSPVYHHHHDTITTTLITAPIPTNACMDDCCVHCAFDSNVHWWQVDYRSSHAMLSSGQLTSFADPLVGLHLYLHHPLANGHCRAAAIIIFVPWGVSAHIF